LEQIFRTGTYKTIFYIGDHEGDVAFARNIEKELPEKNKVIAITAKYSGANPTLWTHKPDFEIETPSDLLQIINNYN